MNNKKGFTLAELLAVIAILAVIAVLTIPAITNVRKKQTEKIYYDQLEQLLMSSKMYVTDNSSILAFDLENQRCSDVNSWKKIKISELQKATTDVSYLSENFINPKTEENFTDEDTYVLVFKEDKSYLYCIMSEDCENSSFDEFSETASQICCNGESFKNKIENKGCKLPVYYLYSPIITVMNEFTWTKEKSVNIDFRKSDNAKYYIKPSENVLTNSIVSTCGTEEPTSVCVGENTQSLIANNWYQVSEVDSIDLTFSSNGTIEAKSYNDLESKNKNKIINKIDNVNPSIVSFSGTSISNSSSGNYNTKELRLTITAKDSESGVDKIELYKNSVSTSNLIGTRNNDTLDETKETFTASIDISNPQQNDSYIAVAYDKAGNTISKTLGGSCSKLSTGSCINGYQTTTYKCPSGYTYSYTNSCSSQTTVTSGSCGTISCPNNYYQCGCSCCYSGSGNTTTTTRYSGGGNTTTTTKGCKVNSSCMSACMAECGSMHASETCTSSYQSYCSSTCCM